MKEMYKAHIRKKCALVLASSVWSVHAEGEKCSEDLDSSLEGDSSASNDADDSIGESSLSPTSSKMEGMEDGASEHDNDIELSVESVKVDSHAVTKTLSILSVSSLSSPLQSLISRVSTESDVVGKTKKRGTRGSAPAV